MVSKIIFISHAAANKDIADKLVDLLGMGIGISDSEIFCSSLEGLGVPSGTNFIEFIRQQIKEPKVVILLLTVDYFSSQFCLCELGAAWVLSHNIIPLLVKPLEFRDMKAVLVGIQCLKIDDKNDLNLMQEQLTALLGRKGKTFARWEVKRDKFLEELASCPSIKKTLKRISEEQFTKLQKQYAEALAEIKAGEKVIEEKNELIEKLKAAKDAPEVQQIMIEVSGAEETFNRLAKNGKAALRKLPRIVREAIYYHIRGDNMQWAGFGGDEQREEMQDAIEKDFLRDTGSGVGIVEEDPKVTEVLKKLHELEQFVFSCQEKHPDFLEYYLQKYNHRLNFKSKRFWETHLY